MIPGEIVTLRGDIILNEGRSVQKLKIINTGDRPIQVGSHFHFYESNEALQFERESSKGWRLNIPAGTAVRFEPGQAREVELIPFEGKKIVFGFNAKVQGKV
ncbi:MAG: urease subunit beta [Pseudomonadota bacterium]|nr:urease subunit beta [Pseudomonadota bacterium]